jgi:hypothetical protein
MGCDGVVVFVVPCVGVDVSVNLDVRIKCGVEVNWRMYHFLDTQRNWYIVGSNFCLEIQWPSMAHIFHSHKQRKCCEKPNIFISVNCHC